MTLLTIPLHVWLAVLVVLALGATATTIFAVRRRPRRAVLPARPSNVVGDATCIACHRDKSTFETTAHRMTMGQPTPATIAGSFASGENVLRVEGSNLRFQMDADSTGFWQSLIAEGGTDTTLRRERVAFVGGSGRKGQSFLYWSGNQLYQLPVSYWTGLHKWIGSPGRAGIAARASFNRAVAPRCFECHATWMESIPDPRVVNRFDSTNAILGITCERCHGSGAEHVARERSVFRRFNRDPAIANPARMTRARTMDACAQCHAGPGEPKTMAFTYVAGRRLEDYLQIVPRALDETVDVHANQVALLERSRCFTSSQMTCITCHDVHRPQRDVAEISNRCLTCHQQTRHAESTTRGQAIAGRCVDCHMPLQTSNLVVSDLEGELERVKGRNHWIRVYPDTARQ